MTVFTENAINKNTAQDTCPAFGIYIHWPFCLSKCPYCDFFSMAGKKFDENEIINEYLQSLEVYQSRLPNKKVGSIFFGGGTPSLMSPAAIEKIIDKITGLWTTEENIEISLEANPGSRKDNLFKELKTAGINRLSLGIQALNDNDLKFLGRRHNSAEALAAADKILKTFNNHSADFIYARPEQTPENWQKELQQALSLGFKHLSLYQLSIEPGTLFFKQGIKPMPEEKAAELYDLTVEYTHHSGYPRYEVSNFSTPGFVCRHNLIYWQGSEYLGIGRGAHGRFRENDHWVATEYNKKEEKLTNEERAAELLLMGLRLCSGINKKIFQKQCGLKLDNIINPSHKAFLLQKGLIIEDCHSLKVSSAGFPLLNRIIEELYA